LRWLFWLGLAGFAVIAAVCLLYGFWASSFDMEAVKEMPQRSTVYDMDGKVWSRLQGENRLLVPLSGVSDHFITALLAREDARFFRHKGVDPIGIARAILRNLGAGSATQGASTLTQQLARNSYAQRIGQRKSVHRKLLEAFVALRIEQRYSKQQILEYYVNRIYFGAGVYGIEAASLAYFGKHASDLTLGERCHHCRDHSQPEPLFSTHQSKGGDARTRHRSRTNGEVKKNRPDDRGQGEEGCVGAFEKADAYRTGELRDGCGASRA
jgi:penicillin-binding protein 1A